MYKPVNYKKFIGGKKNFVRISRNLSDCWRRDTYVNNGKIKLLPLGKLWIEFDDESSVFTYFERKIKKEIGLLSEYTSEEFARYSKSATYEYLSFVIDCYAGKSQNKIKNITYISNNTDRNIVKIIGQIA